MAETIIENIEHIENTDHLAPVPQTEIERGRSVLLKALKTFPVLPGVYRMLGKDGNILYIGKAKNLKNRVTSYTHINELNHRIRQMVGRVYNVVFTVVESESDAIFLEADLIRTIKPPYNVMLKDSSPFVSISLSKNHDFPRIAKHRGPRDYTQYDFCGPFSSVKSVNEALINIQKIFQLRTCSDHFFETRKRPCLQYDIKRCSAPCVNKISREEYRQAVKNSKIFLSGKLVKVRDFLKEEMLQASDQLNFEKAARYRDSLRRLENLKLISQESTGTLSNADVIALLQSPSAPPSDASPSDAAASPSIASLCIHVLIIRNHMYLGGDTFFLTHEARNVSPERNIETFLQQFYLNRDPPVRILLNYMPENKDAMMQALKQRYGKTVKIELPQKGIGVKWINQAVMNAQQRSQYEAKRNMDFATNMEKMTQIFVLPKVPNRVEIYDNSHLQGTYSYGCMVVANREGFEKKSYRRFSVSPHKAENSERKGGDDFAMMHEMFERRFRNADPATMPDLLLIDGGLGQVSAVLDILNTYDLNIPIVGIAKGPDRNAGREHFFIPGWAPFALPEHDPTLHFIQRLRDEAHRFAIGTHRHARDKHLTQSQLSEIPTIGSVRKKILLRTFGSVKQISQASLEDLSKIEGMTEASAQAVYNYFHN